jgi:hypothetical protein
MSQAWEDAMDMLNDRLSTLRELLPRRPPTEDGRDSQEEVITQTLDMGCLALDF